MFKLYNHFDTGEPPPKVKSTENSAANIGQKNDELQTSRTVSRPTESSGKQEKRVISKAAVNEKDSSTKKKLLRSLIIRGEDKFLVGHIKTCSKYL